MMLRCVTAPRPAEISGEIGILVLPILVLIHKILLRARRNVSLKKNDIRKKAAILDICIIPKPITGGGLEGGWTEEIISDR